MREDVIILGAGAAGLMCAIEAAKRGRSTLVIERNDRVGQKIRISGGGRCNFTNVNANAERYLSENPHFAKSAFARYTPADFCELIKKYKIPFHEKKLGQLFCDNSAQDVIDMLTQECARHKAVVMTGVEVKAIRKEDDFLILTNRGDFRGQSLVIATGALSIPPLGATDFGYNVAKQFGLKIRPCRPGLVPLTFNSQDLAIFKDLSGVSVDSVVSFGKTHFRENILFTHRGLSGPAILQISSYWKTGEPISINLCPDTDLFEIFKANRSEKITLKNFLKGRLPSRLLDVFCDRFLVNKPLNQYSQKELQDAAHVLHHWTVTPAGTEGYAKAEVTVGGVDTDELSSKTMETKKVPGLYFIGEVVDVTGHLGGFNFQWAWASGHAAGQSV